MMEWNNCKQNMPIPTRTDDKHAVVFRTTQNSPKTKTVASNSGIDVAK